MFYGNSNLDLEGLFGKLLSNGRPMYSVLSTNNVETEESYEVNHTKDGAYLFFNAPGFNKSNLKVEIEDGIMYLEGNGVTPINFNPFSKIFLLV